MKKLMIAGTIAVLALTVTAGYLYTGGGYKGTITTTPKKISVPNGDRVRTAMLWTDGGECRVLKNCSTNVFNSVGITNALVVGAYPPVVLTGGATSKTIGSIVAATESGTVTLYINWD